MVEDNSNENRLAARAVREAVEGPSARYGWHMMYLGALYALGVSNFEVASEMADLTRSDEESAQVITMMRTGREGDRVWPAMQWLRARRAAG